ncbi:MAG: VRR-NUC domain-containing protein [Bacteroidales bacterium]|jgi:hypothetical protein|nr:VRR-NUC domain-containing protein [Sphaerochaeta sp.]MCK9629301.1 VRR-NUC domain-containing protein [Bacteroidales bacterium]
MRRATERPPVPTEHAEAVAFREWLDTQVALGNVRRYTHLAQETFTRSWGTKRRNHLEGVRPGFPDYCVVVGKGDGVTGLVFVELKRPRGPQGGANGTRLSDEQVAWLRDLNRVGDDCHAAVCYGSGEAIDFVKKFL